MAILSPAPLRAPRACARPGMVASFLAAMLLGLAALPVPAAPGPSSREYQIKAVFLFNFAQFVEWPAETLADAGLPLVIGVLGHDPFGRVLDEVVRGESISGRPLVVQRYRQPDEVGPCHILYISRSETTRLGEVLTRLQGRRVLTVSDIDGAAQQGVMIRFMTENKRIRLRINLEAVRTEHLVISSKLLRPADIVNSKTEGP